MVDFDLLTYTLKVTIGILSTMVIVGIIFITKEEKEKP